MGFFQTVRSIFSTHKHMDAWQRLKPTFKMFGVDVDFPVDYTNLSQLEQFCDHLSDLCYKLLIHPDWSSTYNTPEMLQGFIILACDDAELPFEKVGPIVAQNIQTSFLKEVAGIA